jgi:2-keto-4-pentenoate hydratase/2-oxohepta-3-ene-1,7-dioic acid hydratase in catechol pathway
MKLRRVDTQGDKRVEVRAPRGWVPAATAGAHIGLDPAITVDVVRLLALPPDVQARLVAAAAELDPVPNSSTLLLPFTPLSFRDFMLYEAHAVDAARGFARRFMPAAAQVARGYERLTGRTFPPLRPHRLWYEQPIYYMGNHLTLGVDGDDIRMPAYSRALDYELELGFVLAHPLRDADARLAERAIGGFVVLNDFSARDVQLAEMRSGFGPQKAKHFASAISAVVISADEILPHWQNLRGAVRINGEQTAACSAAGARWSLGEILAHASRGEQLHPGELFGTGTLPGGSGIENGRLLERGDAISLSLDGIGSVTNRIV